MDAKVPMKKQIHHSVTQNWTAPFRGISSKVHLYEVVVAAPLSKSAPFDLWLSHFFIYIFFLSNRKVRCQGTYTAPLCAVHDTGWPEPNAAEMRNLSCKSEGSAVLRCLQCTESHDAQTIHHPANSAAAPAYVPFSVLETLRPMLFTSVMSRFHFLIHGLFFVFVSLLPVSLHFKETSHI